MMRAILVLLLSALLSSSAFAHSPVTSTSPPDGVVVAAPPQAIAMTFDAPVRLTKVAIAVEGGETSDLDLTGAKSFASKFEIPCSIRGSGLYKVTWRALAKDGHVMKGDLSFKVK